MPRDTVMARIGKAVLGAVLAVCAAVVGPAACERAAPVRDASPAGSSESRARLVVLSPALAVTLTDLGLADRIVGRHAYDLVLDRSVPVCGDQAGIDYEALLAARPTHVLIEWGTRELPARLGEMARERGWVVMPFVQLTLNQVRATADELGRELLAPERQGEREKLLARLDRAWSKRGDFESVGRVLILMGTSPTCAALGPGSFHQQVLERIGGVPAIGEGDGKGGSPYMELDAEDVVRLAPEAIVLVVPRAVGTERAKDWMSWERREKLLGSLARTSVPAVRSKRVWVIDDPLALLPGTSLIGVADELEEGLRGMGRAEGR